jgi:hypothetical protein
VCKLDSSGNFLWAKSFGGCTKDKGFSIAADRQGNIICTGYFSGNADFDPGQNVVGLTSSGGSDVFIQVMNQNILTSELERVELINPPLVYPNPASKSILVKLNLADSQTRIDLLDLNGKIRHSTLAAGNINLLELPSEKGIYLVRVWNGNGSNTLKIVVE